MCSDRDSNLIRKLKSSTSLESFFREKDIDIATEFPLKMVRQVSVERHVLRQHILELTGERLVAKRLASLTAKEQPAKKSGGEERERDND